MPSIVIKGIVATHSIGDELLRELPHLIVLALLLIALLFVATKFKWVQCYSIPQWCDVYCRINGHSQIAIITGGPDDPGLGDAKELSDVLLRDRLTYATQFTSDQLSSGLLNQYELVILTKFKRITLEQATTIRDYVNRGGSILWIGDAASEYVNDSSATALALQLNSTHPGYYESYLRQLNATKAQGFGLLGEFLGAQRIGKTNPPTYVRFKTLVGTHPIVAGLNSFSFNFTTPYVTVAEDPRVSTKVAVLVLPNKNETAAILDRRYVGRIVYVSFPPERANSKTLILNLMDYLVQC